MTFSQTHDLIQERIKKLERLREAGIEPYCMPFDSEIKAKDIASEFGEKSKEELEGTQRVVKVAGRLISLRNFGKTAFAHVQDDSDKIQIMVNRLIDIYDTENPHTSIPALIDLYNELAGRTDYWSVCKKDEVRELIRM